MSQSIETDDTDERDLELDDIAQMLRRRLRWAARLPGLHANSVLSLAVLVLVAWVLSGIYKVQPDEQGVVLRFGKWIATTGPGLHYRLPYPIDSVLLPKVTAINQMRLGVAGQGVVIPEGASAQERQMATAAVTSQDNREQQMLTSDENIVEVDCVVFWQIKDAGQFLFHVYQPEAAIKIAVESALREIIGQTTIQAALSERRRQIADETRELVQRWLDADRMGVMITQVQLQRIDPPAAVVDAFNDVQRARADQERARNEAESYANDIIPRARGEAQRIVQESEAYKTQVVNLAEGEAKSFQSVYQSYASAKEVTAWRLYLESVDEMLKKASRVIIDSSGKGVAGVVPYLPMGDQKAAPPPDLKAKPGPAAPAQGATP